MASNLLALPILALMITGLAAVTVWAIKHINRQKQIGGGRGFEIFTGYIVLVATWASALLFTGFIILTLA